MNTDQILSFEEFSTRGTDTATTEAPTTDTAVVDTDSTDTETTDTETTDTEETTTDTEETKEEGKVTEEEDAEEPMAEPTVAEMYKKIGEACKNEAMAYDADDYEQHTTNTYMIEMATLAAETACNAVKEMYDTGEGEYTKDQYEATCKLITEAYAKKCNEACESYGTETGRPAEENEPNQGPEGSIIAK